MCLGTALLAVLRGGGSGTRNISVSTDNRIASSSFDGICIWDLDTGKQLVRFPGGDYISQWVKFTPYAVHVISGGVYSTVRIWNSHTGAQVAELGDKGAGRVESVAVSKDGRKVITGSSDETVRVWDLSSGREIRRLLGHKGTINALDISPDATKIASVGDDGTVRVWDAETGIELRCFKSDYLIYHGWGWKVFLNTVRFSPDSRQIVSGGNDKSIRLWDVELGVPVATFGTDGNNIESVIFTPDGRKVVAGHYDGTIRVWTLTGEQVACHEGHEGGVLCVEVTADGQRIVSVDEHDTIRVWSIEGSSSIPRLHNHNSGVQVMRFSPDGKWLVSGSWDGTLLLWNAENGRPVGILGGEQIKESGVTGLGFSSSGQHLISCGEDGVIRVWDLETRRELRQIRGPRSQLRCVAVSPDERRIAAGTDNGKIWMWEFDTGKKLVRKNCCNNGWVASIAFSHDSKYLASGELEKIKIWDARKGELLRSFGTPGDSEEMIDDIEFMQDGQRLIARGSVVRIWDTKRGVSLKNLGKVGDIGALARGSKRFPFVVRETKHSMVVEDAETYKPIVWYPETPWISKLRTHPSGHIWASAKSTNHVYIFTLEGDRNA
jgi:WD40 repeat protein